MLPTLLPLRKALIALSLFLVDVLLNPGDLTHMKVGIALVIALISMHIHF